MMFYRPRTDRLPIRGDVQHGTDRSGTQEVRFRYLLRETAPERWQALNPGFERKIRKLQELTGTNPPRAEDLRYGTGPVAAIGVPIVHSWPTAGGDPHDPYLVTPNPPWGKAPWNTFGLTTGQHREVVVDVILRVARAVGRLHTMGLYQYGIDPEAIAVAVDGQRVMLLDPFLDLDGKARAGQLDGSRNLGAAEHTDPVREASDEQVDVYSLVSVLYAGLCGAPPVPKRDGEPVADYLKRKSTTPVTVPTTDRADDPLPQGLRDVLRSGLSLDLGERPPLAELERTLAPFCKKRPIGPLVALAAGVGSALAIVAVWFAHSFWPRDPAPAAEIEAVPEVTVCAPRATYPFLRGMVEHFVHGEGASTANSAGAECFTGWVGKPRWEGGEEKTARVCVTRAVEDCTVTAKLVDPTARRSSAERSLGLVGVTLLGEQTVEGGPVLSEGLSLNQVRERERQGTLGGDEQAKLLLKEVLGLHMGPGKGPQGPAPGGSWRQALIEVATTLGDAKDRAQLAVGGYTFSVKTLDGWQYPLYADLRLEGTGDDLGFVDHAQGASARMAFTEAGGTLHVTQVVQLEVGASATFASAAACAGQEFVFQFSGSPAEVTYIEKTRRKNEKTPPRDRVTRLLDSWKNAGTPGDEPVGLIIVGRADLTGTFSGSCKVATMRGNEARAEVDAAIDNWMLGHPDVLRPHVVVLQGRPTSRKDTERVANIYLVSNTVRSCLELARRPDHPAPPPTPEPIAAMADAPPVRRTREVGGDYVIDARGATGRREFCL